MPDLVPTVASLGHVLYVAPDPTGPVLCCVSAHFGYSGTCAICVAYQGAICSMGPEPAYSVDLRPARMCTLWLVPQALCTLRGSTIRPRVSTRGWIGGSMGWIQFVDHIFDTPALEQTCQMHCPSAGGLAVIGPPSPGTDPRSEAVHPVVCLRAEEPRSPRYVALEVCSVKLIYMYIQNICMGTQ